MRKTRIGLELDQCPLPVRGKGAPVGPNASCRTYGFDLHQGVAAPASHGAGMEETLIMHAPACPSCGRPMHLARTIPPRSGQPGVRTYICKSCGVSLMEAADTAT